MLEKDFQEMIVQLATMMRLAVYHTHDSRRSEPGFPDLVIVGNHGVLFRELKTDKGKLSPDQRFWLGALLAAGQDARVWRPTLDWPEKIRLEMRAIGGVRVQRPPKKLR